MSSSPTATAPAALARATETIPLEDRLPTFAELDGFDAGVAWDRLTSAQQREIGMLALRYGTIGQCTGYFHETLSEVQRGFESAHWTPAAQATAVWPAEHIDMVERAAEAAFNALTNHFDPLWPQLFGWIAPRWSKPVIRQVA